MIGRLFIGDVEINKQMLRDGAAWFNDPESDGWGREYQEIETLAKNEKRGVWGVEGLKPAWEFRAQEYAKKTNVNTPKQAVDFKVSYSELPDKISQTTYIAETAKVPAGFIVVGVGYVGQASDRKLVKVIKKPNSGDLSCYGYQIPSPYIKSQVTISKLCPTTAFGGNANYIENGRELARAYANTALNNLGVAFRMYKVSGNANEFAYILMMNFFFQITTYNLFLANCYV
jgi:hypothetical protein